MPAGNRNKFGLSLPMDRICRGFDGSYGNAPSPPPSPSSAALNSPKPPRPVPTPPSSPRKTERKVAASMATSMSKLERSESEELQRLVHEPPYRKSKKKLSKQLSLREARDKAWEKRRKQVLLQAKKRRNSMTSVPSAAATDGGILTDEDLNELKGSIELGFGFNEEEGHKLCETLPALDLYFAVNRQLSPASSPRSPSGGRSSIDCPSSEDSWRIRTPGDSPKQVKTRLRHWAQAVACSVKQSL